ncbi:competence protein CoiA family protein [Shimia thalassica]|uniref:competence protein CoiA family protein n=1 Tax=Shimia thalassica TaxID=1715693 RepID=UPI00273271B8|nr:competence protein CoiA family protein [Shimia thalassica]MDP2493928.1 competence protein CoiA family protein [Shimia thalassica]
MPEIHTLRRRIFKSKLLEEWHEQRNLKMGDVRFNYAIGSTGNVLRIDQVDVKDRHASGPFRCPGCKRELIPALGKIKAHHFKHKDERLPTCSNESYLHFLAKHVLFEALSRAILEGKPYHLIARLPQICKRHEETMGVICKNSSLPQFWDVTKWFDTVDIEKGVGGFVADVLLSSSRTDEKLLLEVQVTHPCELEKIKSRLRIVEIQIHDEDDVEKLWKGVDLEQGNICTYNFKAIKPIEENCRGNCRQEGTAFFVFESGTTLIHTTALEEIALIKGRKSTLYCEFLGMGYVYFGPKIIEVYFEETVRAHFKNKIPVKSCLLCRNGGLGAYDDPIYCFEQKVGTKINAAAKCPNYRPDTSEKFARQRFQRSLKYIE